MSTSARKLMIPALIVAVGFVVLTWPRDAHLHYQSCGPKGWIGAASAAIHGERFWDHQLSNVRAKRIAAERERDDYPRQVAAEAELTAKIDKMIERDFPEDLRSMTPAELEVQRLRRLADEIEEREMHRQEMEILVQQVAMLSSCEALITKRLTR